MASSWSLARVMAPLKELLDLLAEAKSTGALLLDITAGTR